MSKGGNEEDRGNITVPGFGCWLERISATSLVADNGTKLHFLFLLL